MTNLETLDGRRDASGGYKVDISRGERIGRVSSEWFSRPDDERYLSLSELYASVKGRAERSRTRTAESAAIRVEAHRDDPENLALILPDDAAPIAPTHWSFGQLASLVSAPAAYLRQPCPRSSARSFCRVLFETVIPVCRVKYCKPPPTLVAKVKLSPEFLHRCW